jgi:Protein of unknown function (DUF3106)
MTRCRPIRPWSAAMLAAAQLVLSSSMAQGPPSPPDNAADPLADYQPVPRSPVDAFRQLLAMSPAERRQTLAGRPPEIQRSLLAKVREYESLSPERRELRLKATELHYYLWPLMTSPATNRSAQLALIPKPDRALVEGRLLEWDKLDAPKQQELLTNAATLRYFTEVQAGPPPVPDISPARRERLETGVREWRRIPPSQRQRILARFNRFFELTPDEQDKALTTLSDAERRQIEKTIDHFSSLSPSDRNQCIRSFDKYTSLSLVERQQFLKNAERWKLMPAVERGQWIQVVKEVPHMPPLPPGLILMPPAPPGLKSPPPPSTLAPTNALPSDP